MHKKPKDFSDVRSERIARNDSDWLWPEFRGWKKKTPLAFALVLWRDVQNVWKRSHADEGADAFAGSGGAVWPWKPVSAGSALSLCDTFNWEKSARQVVSVVRFE
jgi:hypothetical protein